MKLVDANVLLYAVNSASANHVSARVWLDGALSGTETVGFAWPVLLAFVRISTHPAIFRSPLAPAIALRAVQDWLAQPIAVAVHPTSRHADILGGLLSSVGTAGNLVSDAHLAALAIEHDADVVSYDADFGRFAGFRWIRPGE